MAILIKGMEMPESCFLCRFCRRQEYGEYVGEDTARSCVASKKRITDGQDLIATFKHPDCPLVEVDRDNLIDANKTIHAQIYNDQYEEFINKSMTIAEFLDNYTYDGCPMSVIDEGE